MSQSEHAQAAKAIRKVIKDMGLKAKVRSEVYSGGSSVWASVVNPQKEQIEAIETATSKYQMGNFDGMYDIYEYNNSQDCAQVKYVFIEAEYTDEILQGAWDFVRGRLHGADKAPENQNDAWRWRDEGTGETGFAWIMKAINGSFEGFTFK